MEFNNLSKKWKIVVILFTVKWLSMFCYLLIEMLCDSKYSITVLSNDEYLENCKSYKRILYKHISLSTWACGIVDSSVSNISPFWHCIPSKSVDLINVRIFMSICDCYSMFLSPCSVTLNGHAFGLLIRSYHATKFKSVEKKIVFYNYSKKVKKKTYG